MSSFVSDIQLRNLKEYKYRAIDKSPIANYILQHYWNWAITLFPMWIAPNLITLIGFGFIIFNLLLVLLFTPDFETQGPSWIYFSFAIGLWLYSTFDNVDGKQARRTGTSSPLGELFDHGCDALNATMASMMQAATLGLGSSWYSALLVITTASTFYMSTWETYHTGYLYLGYINGPTEGVILSCISMVFTGLYGIKFWLQPTKNVLPTIFQYILPQSLKMSELVLLFIMITSITTQIPVSIYRALQANIEKNHDIMITAKQSYPFLALIGSIFLWLSNSQSTIIQENFYLFGLILTFVFGRIAAKIVLAHVTHTEFPMFSLSLLPMYIGALLSNAPVIFRIDPWFTAKTELLYLWMYFIFALANYSFWTYAVTTQLCRHLRINCLTIPYKKESSKTKSN